MNLTILSFKMLILFSLAVSVPYFGQNIQWMESANKSTADQSKVIAGSVFPNYKIIDEYKEGMHYVYKLVPPTLSQDQLQDCANGNNCPESVSVSFKVTGDQYSFEYAKGSSKVLMPFWSASISSNSDSYKNRDLKLWYNFTNVGNKSIISNESWRSSDDW